MGSRMIRVAPTPEMLARMAAEQVALAAREAQAERRRFSLVLAGGSTPQSLYRLLAGEAYADRIAWGRTEVFFGDERCVPPDHAQSNYRMAMEAMLGKLPIPPAQIHRMRGEIVPEAAAAEYDALLRGFFGDGGADLVLLGLGDDAHTASLFPHTQALGATDKLCVANWVEKLQAHRLSMTAPFINRAKQVIFLVAGAGKAPAVRQVLEGPSDPSRLPAQSIDPRDGQLLWLLDAAAAEMEAGDSQERP